MRFRSSGLPAYIAPDNLLGVRLFTTTGYSHHFEASNPGMLGAIAKSLFGSSNDRYVKSIFKTVERINGFEPAMSAMSDDELRQQTQMFREQLANGAKLDDLLPEAFATVREAAKRTMGQRHYDVQMVGGIVLHRGEIAAMRNGEIGRAH